MSLDCPFQDTLCPAATKNIILSNMLLKANKKWTANQGIELPTVLANVTNGGDFLQFDFNVEEPASCFRAEVTEDNGRSWEDSCVEFFLQSPSLPEEYFNFEITSRGFLLAAKGKDRNNRTPLSAEELSKIKRAKTLASVVGEFVCWGMCITIPAKLFGLQSFENVKIFGNLYKCGDKAKTPHYLSAFPIETEKPDFHRPEFFQQII